MIKIPHFRKEGSEIGEAPRNAVMLDMSNEDLTFYSRNGKAISVAQLLEAAPKP